MAPSDRSGPRPPTRRAPRPKATSAPPAGQKPQAKVPETGPMAAMLKKLFGGELKWTVSEHPRHR